MDLNNGKNRLEGTLRLKETFSSDESQEMLKLVWATISHLDIPWTADIGRYRGALVINLFPSNKYLLTPEMADYRTASFPVSILTLDQIYDQRGRLQETLEMDIIGELSILEILPVEEEQADGTTDVFAEEKELVRLTFE